MWQAAGGEVKHYIYMQQINDKIRVAMIKKKKRKQNFTPMLRDSCPRNSDTIAIFTVVGKKKSHNQISL